MATVLKPDLPGAVIGGAIFVLLSLTMDRLIVRPVRTGDIPRR